jgi:uncharacterized protein DUF1579
MKKLHTIVTISILAVAGAAWGQGAAGDKAAAKPAPAADKPPEMAMKPAPELKKEYEGMIGTWKCEGKGSMGGKEMKAKGTMKAAWDLDGYWVASTIEARVEGMPGVHKSKDMYGYDATKKQFVNIGVDGMGGWGMMTSPGWQGDKEEWTGKATMMGKETDVKFTITKNGPKEVTISGSMAGDAFENHCKKQ